MNPSKLFALFIFVFVLASAVPVHAQTQYYALSFDGENDYLTAQGISSDQLSVVVLFKATATDGERTLFDGRKWGDDFGGWNLRVEDGVLKFLTVWNNAGSYAEAEISTNADTNKAYLAVAVHDGTESKLYVNGELKGTVAVDGLTENSESTLWIGVNRANSGFFAGKIYLVLIYNRALSDSEIQAIYNDPLNPPTNGLVVWYAPDSVDTANGLWKDKSGQGNDGTIYRATAEQIAILKFNVYSVTRGALNATVEDLTAGFSSFSHFVPAPYSTNPHTFEISASGYHPIRVITVPNAEKSFNVFLAPIQAPAEPEPVGSDIGQMFNENMGNTVITGLMVLLIIFAFMVKAKVGGSVGAVIGIVLIIALAGGGYLPQPLLFIALFGAGALAYYVIINAIGIGRR